MDKFNGFSVDQITGIYFYEAKATQVFFNLVHWAIAIINIPFAVDDHLVDIGFYVIDILNVDFVFRPVFLAEDVFAVAF